LVDEGVGHPIAGSTTLRQTLFQRSLEPMLICDTDRRCVDANVASCLFLRSPRETIIDSRLDALVPPEQRADSDARWASVRARAGAARLVRVADELAMPDGTRVAATLSVAGILPDRQLVVIDFQADPLTAEASPRVARALTDREREILKLVAVGNTGIEIAAELYLSPATVQTHVNNALLKLNARNRTHGIAIAITTREIDFESPELLNVADCSLLR
jgi:DNA-binding CsgD family transcriptional regulator